MKNSFSIILILMMLGSCEKQDNLYFLNAHNGIKISDIISITSLSTMQTDADSLSSIDITIRVASQADTNLNKVIFTCSGGVFQNGDTIVTAKPDALGKAYASLVDSKQEKVRITAKVANFSVDTVVSFIAALPDDMLMVANSYIVDTSVGFTITNTLVRNPNRGIVTDPIKVIFNIVPLDTTINLIYPGFAFSQNRQTTIIISNPYKVNGRFDIRAKTVSANGDTLSKIIHVNIR